jgi:hypothetical protein
VSDLRHRCEWWAWVDLNHRPRPYQGLLTVVAVNQEVTLLY